MTKQTLTLKSLQQEFNNKISMLEKKLEVESGKIGDTEEIHKKLKEIQQLIEINEPYHFRELTKQIKIDKLTIEVIKLILK